MEHNPITPNAKHAQRLADFKKSLSYRQLLCFKALEAEATGNSEELQRCHCLLDEYERGLVKEYSDGSFWAIDKEGVNLDNWLHYDRFGIERGLRTNKETDEPNCWTYYDRYCTPMFKLSASQGCQSKKWHFRVHFQDYHITFGSKYTLTPECIQDMMQNAVLRFKK